MNLMKWQKRFGTEEACAEALKQQIGPNSFQSPTCGHDHGHQVTTRKVQQGGRHHHQTSVTAGTQLHATNLSLVHWLLAIQLMVSDKSGVSQVTANCMLRNISKAMGDRDGIYRLEGLVVMDEAFFGGHHSGGKCVRGAEGQTPTLVAVERRGKKAGFIAIEAVHSVCSEQVQRFSMRRLLPYQSLRTDVLAVLCVVAATRHHDGRPTSPEQTREWLPWIHNIAAIGNLKAQLLGMYHRGSGQYLQECLNEFANRFNRRFWEAELSLRLLNACMEQRPIRLAVKKG